MHWRAIASEWAYVLAGHRQTTAPDPSGEVEVANLDPGDLWHLPAGHAHAIQTLGEAPCHAVLVLEDGLYSEHGTSGISDWLSRLDPGLLAQTFGVPASALAGLPEGETYIPQGPVIPLAGPEAGTATRSRTPGRRSASSSPCPVPAATRKARARSGRPQRRRTCPRLRPRPERSPASR